ncbi:hypothetical protein HYG81_17005 [Natrinema zhouii]|uniref:Domain of unknown function domain-containing protein n=1 Tax=Natrinema zhouii TaxID=1710539 RepID=A0A7D6CP91_9EURY|nr:hypothetical protein [Natrinema zhouii]QLK25756.1 hypothetical protein HYG81_17005 [Natrinema zhouii]
MTEEEYFIDRADRKRGILTKSDREYLMGKKDFDNGQQLRDTRYRIRERFKAAYLDLVLMFATWPTSEYISILESGQDEDEPHIGNATGVPSPFFHMGLKFHYIGNRKDWFGDGWRANLSLEDELADRLVTNIAHVERQLLENEKISHGKRGEIPTDISVDIDIERDQFDNESMLRKLVHGDPTHEELFFFLRNGNVDELRRRLRKYDAEIVYENSAGEEVNVGPDDELFRYA